MAELRRYDLPGTQGSLTVLPGQDPLGATAEERRQSPASQALLRRIDEQQEERAALAKARFEKSKLGLIPAEGGGEKDRRRQYLISQAGKHGVPQNVLAKQMQIEGLEREAPAGPMVKTPYGELPADVGFRYLPKEAQPVKAPSAQWKVIKDPKSNTGYSYQNLAVPAEIRREAPAPKKAGTGPGSGKKTGRLKTAEVNLLNKGIISTMLPGTNIEAGGIFDAVTGTVNEGLFRQKLRKGIEKTGEEYEDQYKLYTKIKQFAQRGYRDTEMTPADAITYAFKAAGAGHLIPGEAAKTGGPLIPDGTEMGKELVTYGDGKQGYEVRDSTGELQGYARVR